MTLSLSCKTFSELTTEELYEILKLRQEIFIVEQDCPYLDADGIDKLSHHILLTDAENILHSYTRIVPAGLSYKDYTAIGRVVTSKSSRGQKLGHKNMVFSIQKAKELYPGVPIKLSAQVYILDFYRKLGFKAVGDAYLEDNIPHKAMILSG